MKTVIARKKFRTLLCAVLSVPAVLPLCAQEADRRPRWQVDLVGALDNYEAWEVEPSVTYRPFAYVGATLGLLFVSPYRGESPGGVAQDVRFLWSLADDRADSHFLALRPAFRLDTPRLWLGRDRDCALCLSVSPGLTLPLPSNRRFSVDYFPNREGAWTAVRREEVVNRGARAVFWHLRAALSLELDEAVVFSAGYTVSDFDLYAGSRNVVIEGKRLDRPKHGLMHSVFVGIGCRF